MGFFEKLRTFFLVVAGVVLLLASTDCGGPGRRDARTASGLPEAISGGQKGIALSLDPTEVGLTRLQAAADSFVVDKQIYRIGPEDKLEISIYARSFNEETKAEEVLVRDDGKIYVELLGELQAAGRTVNELREEITRGAVPFVKDPFVQVSIKEYNSQRATIIGEIGGGAGTQGGRAITVPLQGPTRLIDLLATTVLTTGEVLGNISGSPRLDADLANIIVTRRTGERYRINLNTYLFGLDISANIEIYDGDLIFIPHQRDNRVFVLGEVNTPGVLPIGLGMTVTEAITRSGGFTNIARRNDVKVVRGGLEDPDVLSVPVKDVANKGRRTSDMPLRNGDIIYIPRSPLGDINILLSQILPPLQTYLLLQTLVK